MDSRQVIIRPIITEKSYRLIELNQYCFEVAKTARKPQIRAAVEEIFDVTVNRVNVMSVPGKQKRRGRVVGRTKDWKKAIVTLQEGDSIEVFEGGQA